GAKRCAQGLGARLEERSRSIVATTSRNLSRPNGAQLPQCQRQAAQKSLGQLQQCQRYHAQLVFDAIALAPYRLRAAARTGAHQSHAPRRALLAGIRAARIATQATSPRDRHLSANTRATSTNCDIMVAWL